MQTERNEDFSKWNRKRLLPLHTAIRNGHCSCALQSDMICIYIPRMMEGIRICVFMWALQSVREN